MQATEAGAIPPAHAHAASPAVSSDIAAALINARLDRLPGTRSIWTMVLLLSLGGWFELYDLFFTAYVGPGLVRSGLFSSTTASFFGMSGLASFVAATFTGLFIGTMVFGFVADRFGRRSIFTFSLIWYTAATVTMAFQTSADTINLWRLIAGIGIGVELVTIDTYLAELVPKDMRGRAFAFNQAVQFSVVPVVAFLAWYLVPLSPMGFDGWRWVVLIGAFGAVCVWFIRLGLPESPRWLAQRGRFAEAEQIVARLEAKVATEYGKPLPPQPMPHREEASVGLGEIFTPQYRGRTIMLMVFNFFQTIGFYGFANWVPTLLIAKGITVTTSLEYAFIIAIANPVGPLLGMAIADRVELKWIIAGSAVGIAVFGVLFSQQQSMAMLILFGVLITLANNCMSFSFHGYQSELFPTRVRARAVGFVYSWSRLSAIFTSFMIAFFLRDFGVTGVFTFIALSMAVVVIAIGGFGPRTRGLQLEAISR
ncbi:MAG: MFS transporter [Alphaproteobacteria bacterium]|nr:MFS transporter [Alphaproteobacteria bacterium]